MTTKIEMTTKKTNNRQAGFDGQHSRFKTLSKQQYACSDTTSAPPPRIRTYTPFLGFYSAYLPIGGRKHQNIFCLTIALQLLLQGDLIF